MSSQRTGNVVFVFASVAYEYVIFHGASVVSACARGTEVRLNVWLGLLTIENNLQVIECFSQITTVTLDDKKILPRRVDADSWPWAARQHCNSATIFYVVLMSESATKDVVYVMFCPESLVVGAQ